MKKLLNFKFIVIDKMVNFDFDKCACIIIKLLNKLP